MPETYIGRWLKGMHGAAFPIISALLWLVVANIFIEIGWAHLPDGGRAWWLLAPIVLFLLTLHPFIFNIGGSDA